MVLRPLVRGPHFEYQGEQTGPKKLNPPDPKLRYLELGLA